MFLIIFNVSIPYASLSFVLFKFVIKCIFTFGIPIILLYYFIQLCKWSFEFS